jgi:hypothetical protein
VIAWERIMPEIDEAEPGTTKLYDRRGYNPEKSASFCATY